MYNKWIELSLGITTFFNIRFFVLAGAFTVVAPAAWLGRAER